MALLTVSKAPENTVPFCVVLRLSLSRTPEHGTDLALSRCMPQLTVRLRLTLRGMPLYMGDDAMAQRNKKMLQPKDAIAMLKADHQKVRDLFQQYGATSDVEAKGTIADEVFIELETHTQLEENIFYPAVNEEIDEGPEVAHDHIRVSGLPCALQAQGFSFSHIDS
jgi:hemerythrin HHE cation binding domain-containing protein